MRHAFSCLRNFLLLTTVILSCAAVANAQQSTAPPKKSAETQRPERAIKGEVRPRIRTITAFINLDPAQYKQQVAETMQMLRRSRFPSTPRA